MTHHFKQPFLTLPYRYSTFYYYYSYYRNIRATSSQQYFYNKAHIFPFAFCNVLSKAFTIKCDISIQHSALNCYSTVGDKKTFAQYSFVTVQNLVFRIQIVSPNVPLIQTVLTQFGTNEHLRLYVRYNFYRTMDMVFNTRL